MDQKIITETLNNWIGKIVAYEGKTFNARVRVIGWTYDNIDGEYLCVVKDCIEDRRGLIRIKESMGENVFARFAIDNLYRPESIVQNQPEYMVPNEEKETEDELLGS